MKPRVWTQRLRPPTRAMMLAMRWAPEKKAQTRPVKRPATSGVTDEERAGAMIIQYPITMITRSKSDTAMV